MNKVSEESQLLTDLSDVNLQITNAAYMINYPYTTIYMEKILNTHFLDIEK